MPCIYVCAAIILLVFIINSPRRIMLNIQSITGCRDRTSMPLHKSNERILLQELKKYTNYTHFYDIGCGEGNILKEVANRNLFPNIIGVEVSKLTYQIAKKKLNDYKNIKLVHKSMEDVSYVNKPSVIYMYEPLWTMKKGSKRVFIRNKFMEQLSSIDDVVLIYMTGMNHNRKVFKDDFIKSYGYNLIRETPMLNDIPFLKTSRLQIWQRKL